MLTLLADLTPASAVCLSVSVYAAASIPVLLVPADVDLRPAVRRTTAVVHQGLVHAGHDLDRAVASTRHHLAPAAACAWNAAFTAREMARDVAALLLMLTTIPTGDRS